MSEENLDAFWRGADAFKREDLEEILGLVDPEVVWEPLRAATEGAFVGHEGIRRFWADTVETFDHFSPTTQTSGTSATAFSQLGRSGCAEGEAASRPMSRQPPSSNTGVEWCGDTRTMGRSG